MLAACSGIIPFSQKNLVPVSASNVKLVFPTDAQDRNIYAKVISSLLSRDTVH